MMTRSKRKADSDDQNSASTRRRPTTESSSSADVAELPLMEPTRMNQLLRVASQEPAVEKVSVPRVLEIIFPFETGNLGASLHNKVVKIYCADGKQTITRPKDSLITSDVTALPVDINHEIGHYRRIVANDGSAKRFIATFIEVLSDRLKCMDRPSMMFVLSSRELLNALELDRKDTLFALVGLWLIRLAANTVANHDAKTRTLTELIRLTLRSCGDSLLDKVGNIAGVTSIALDTAHRLLTDLQMKSHLSEHDIELVGAIARQVKTIGTDKPESEQFRDRIRCFCHSVYNLLDVMARSTSLSEAVMLQSKNWTKEVSKVFDREFERAAALDRESRLQSARPHSNLQSANSS